MLGNLQNENNTRSTNGFLHIFDMYEVNLPAHVHVARLERSCIGSRSNFHSLCYVVRSLVSQVTFFKVMTLDFLITDTTN